MTQQKRKKRPPPSRSGPRRSFLHHDHLAGSAQPGAAPAPAAQAGGIDEVVGNAVKLGYQVVEEQLQQGRESARRIREGTYTTAELEDDVNALVDRLVRVTQDATAAWLDIVSAVARAGAPAMTGAGASAMAGAPVRPGRRSEPNFAVEVNSPHPAQVTLDLAPASQRFVPVVHSLQGTHGRKHKPIGVRFKLSPDGSRGVLVVTVPDDIEAGTYTGAVVDSATHRPGGTLRVDIHPKQAHTPNASNMKSP
jgi:hypothetical protein